MAERQSPSLQEPRLRGRHSPALSLPSEGGAFSLGELTLWPDVVTTHSLHIHQGTGQDGRGTLDVDPGLEGLPSPDESP